MKKFAAKKRNQLAFLALGTTVAISLYWAFIIRVQQEWLIEKRGAVEALRQRIHIGKNNAAKLPQFRMDLEKSQRNLLVYEADMPNGDVYRWLIRTFLTQQTDEAIQAVDVTPPNLVEVSVLPRIPYMEGIFKISGKGYYHDIGRFIADLENRYVHMRIRKLDLDPAHLGDPGSEESEKLIFTLEVSTLVSTNEYKFAEAPVPGATEAPKEGKEK